MRGTSKSRQLAVGKDLSFFSSPLCAKNCEYMEKLVLLYPFLAFFFLASGVGEGEGERFLFL